MSFTRNALFAGSTLALGVPLVGCGGERPIDADTDAADTDDTAGTADVPGTGGTTDGVDTTADATEEPPPEVEAICDGSSGIRLGIYLPTSIGRVEPVSYMQWENGARFLFVLGDCTYWVSGPTVPSQSQRYHTGVLSADDAARLAEDVHYGQWRAMELVGYWLPALDEFDVATTVFYDGVDVVVCQGGCEAPGVRPEVQAMRDLEHDWVEQLWNEGAAVDGPVRILAVRMLELTPYETIDVAQWPLDAPLEDIAWDDPDLVPQEAGQSVRFDVPDSLALIGIWEEYLSGVHGNLWQSHGIIPFVGADPQVRYRVFVRDSLPFEDALGLVDAPDIR